ncbi:chromosomal replication initiator protein DnaA [Sandaracinobacter sp. RS1-74]|uniref:chromosomal replication initiator protein DnaA n=1 Tax=Sandaracinobacteroides sayramensis TaxID=2913411 RepID=UPI001EDAC277|nr:chromosomal replication initiator protein DnaA [Sandaracinobacteroides sayramensis]MCG2841870.1 chromosomal replication initiator protein DnaA [Sandaracinobacteroides sayramensis]
MPAEPLRQQGASRADSAGGLNADALRTWGLVRAHLLSDVGEKTFNSWLKPLQLLSVSGGEVRLAVPSRFMADWVKNHFADRLRHAFAAHIPGIRNVAIEVGAIEVGAGAAIVSEEAPEAAPAEADAGEPVNFEPRYSFDSFVVGKSNELAFNAGQAMASAVTSGKAAGFNPLFLHGPTGLGKTHLMHAIGSQVLAANPKAKVVYLSAERFMVEFLAALRARDTISFKRRLRSADLLMVDDVQFIAGKDSTQEEFFHTMNEIISAGRWLVISADRSPQNLEGIESRILSRLAWGLVADINPADFELRYNILKTKLSAMPGTDVPDDVVQFLARKIVANVRELEGALNRVIAYGNLVGRKLDLDFTREVLADVLRAHSRKLTIDEIQRRVADHYALKINDLISPRRAREVARPRQVAMYLAKMLTPRSLPEIGRRFGGRDHTTVMHAVKRIEELRATDHELDRDINQLRRALDS